jgi:tRNA pseudouridine38-40 synthase
MRYALGPSNTTAPTSSAGSACRHGAPLQAAVEKAAVLRRRRRGRRGLRRAHRRRRACRCQVAHFDSDAAGADPRAWVLGSNSRLPPRSRVLWAQPVAADFHARYSARARRYRYRILNRPCAPRCTRAPGLGAPPLDADAMHRAAQALVGEHDFSAFRTSACQARTRAATCSAIEVRREGEVVEIEVQANAFLHHMVRNIVGSLLPIGAAKARGWIGELLAGRDRTVAGPTAPAAGLCSSGRCIPPEWGPARGGQPVTGRFTAAHAHQVLRHDPAGDVALAGELGVDAIGLCCAGQPAPQVSPRPGARAARALPAAGRRRWRCSWTRRSRAARDTRHREADLLQFHGARPTRSAAAGLPYLKAVPMGGGEAIRWRR